MRASIRFGFLLLSGAASAACESHPSTGLAGSGTAAVRLVNATPYSFDIASSGTVSPTNGNLGYGAKSGCIGVDAGASTLSVREAGSTTALPGFTPVFGDAGKYVVVAYLATSGTTQFASFVTNGFLPTTGQAGLTVFNAATGTGNFDVYLTVPGAALGTASATSLSPGSSTTFFGVNAGTVQVRLTSSGSQSVAFDAGSQTLAAGQNYVLVIAPPATGGTGLRSFLVTAC